jgi:hypothetical protein
VILDVAISCDDEPAVRSYRRDPDVILGCRIGNDTWRPYTFADQAPWIAWVSRIRTQSTDDVRKPKDIGVDIEPNRRWLAHA